MPSSHPAPPSCHWFSRLAPALDRRSAPLLVVLFLGAILARGRRTVTSWIRAAGLSREYRRCYTTVSAAGKRTDLIAAHLAHEMVKPLVAGATRLTFALDDTPTEQHGRHVQGAGVHHNPCPGPANSPFVYGHVWVVLGLLAAHPAWGVIALPLLARLYIREKSLASITPEHRPAFTTKLELAVDLMRWSVRWLGFLGKPLWVVVDGAYAKAPFLKPMRSLGVTMVSRLRRDAALWTTPRPRRPGQRGTQRIYGKHRIDLAKRAGQRRGWATGTFDLYGKAVVKRYKTFV
ncbi:MAG TPA: transposase, partial [Gemmataceae bacterium]|nr:transposase [Gemmataceae bacterium]